MKRILVVGAGFAGATAARELADAGFQVHIIDKRRHLAGNAFDYVNHHGIRVHKYGPHLFHTKNEDVFSFLQRFSDWVPYQHRVKAQLSDGRYVTLPVNRETKEIVGEEHVLDIFFRPYTKKMWGVELDELDPSIIKRVPIRDDYNELYFPNDPFQALPVEGYTVLVRNMLFHQNITIELDKAFSREMEADYDHIFNSMPIDQYFNFSLGELPYRSIKFHEFHLPMPLALPAPVVNFTHDGPYTRVTEWKQLTNSNNNMYMTSLTFEEPCDYRDNYQERYYPVKDVSGKNRDLYHQYVELAKENEKMTFIGRCGLYVYIDIDQAIASTQATVRRFLKEQQ